MSAGSTPLYNLLPSSVTATACGEADVFGGRAGPLPLDGRGCGVRLKNSDSIFTFSRNVGPSMMTTCADDGTETKIVWPSALIAPSCGWLAVFSWFRILPETGSTSKTIESL